MTIKKKSSLAAGILGITLLCSLLPGTLTAYGEGLQNTASNPAETGRAEHPQNGQHKHPRGHFFGFHAIKTTAELIGVSDQQLIAELKTGKTLSQIVQEKKGWPESEYIAKLTDSSSKRIDAAVQQGKIDAERASKIKAALPSKLKETVNKNWSQWLSSKPGTKMLPSDGIFRQKEAKLSE